MMNVLVVEDDKWLAEQFCRVLNNSGYKSKMVLNAIDAIDEIDRSCPDVIILDVLLTGSTAFALLGELQSYCDTGKIPVILCTNLAADFKLADLKYYGVKRIIDKSKMVPEDLVAAIRSVV
jgi:twitching motility two-component system response regulator PilH